MSKAEEIHFSEGEKWEEDVIKNLRSQRNAMTIVSIISLIVALVAVFAIAALTPLKTVEPFVVEVDVKTGRAEVLSLYRGDVKTLSINEQLAKYFIGKYLVARESHNPNLDIEENYVLVQELSEGRGFNTYAKRFADEHPENPFSRYGENTAKVKIISISFLRGDTATIRYSITEQKTQEADLVTHYIDILNYKFTSVPTGEAARMKNPLGFKVTEYRTDQELLN